MATDRKKDRHSAGYLERYKKENYLQIMVRIRKDSGMVEALELVSRLTGMPRTQYILNALQEKLQEDGYMPEK